MDADLNGRVFGTTRPYEVSAAKINELNFVLTGILGSTDELAAGPAVAPPTFAMLLCREALLVMCAELGEVPPGIVHRGQHFAYQRPIRAGDQLCARARVTRHTRPADIDTLTIEVDIETADGLPVCLATMLIAMPPLPADSGR